MQYCQGTRCHEYKTRDRIRGTKGAKYYATRRKSRFYYSDNFCSLNCQNDWLNQNIENALNHFGRATEAKRVECDAAWYKHRDWRGYQDNIYYFINDLLGERIAITETQYNDDNIKQPTDRYPIKE